MPELKLEQKFKNILDSFLRKLQELYPDELISVILYGSAASGEFINKHSNLNLLVVLKNTDLENLKRAAGLINNRKFSNIHPLFFTEEYMQRSLDVFPIEFLDLKENYAVLSGKDVLKDAVIDTRNLRFQCEQELKAKLIKLRQGYLKSAKDKDSLKYLLFQSFTSVMHILRNVLRLKAKHPPYLKEDILKALSQDLPIDKAAWEKILSAKNKKITLKAQEIEQLFIIFAKDLENLVNIVDAL